MRTATGLALVAVGAILAFAVNAQPSFLNLHVVGWVLVLTGVAGMVIPARSYGWLRRRLVWRRGAGGPVAEQVEESEYPSSYVLSKPGRTTSWSTGDDDVPAAHSPPPAPAPDRRLTAGGGQPPWPSGPGSSRNREGQ